MSGMAVLHVSGVSQYTTAHDRVVSCGDCFSKGKFIAADRCAGGAIYKRCIYLIGHA